LNVIGSYGTGRGKKTAKSFAAVRHGNATGRAKNNAALQLEGGIVNRGLIPLCLYPQPAPMAFQPDAPPWLLADNVLIFVLFPRPWSAVWAAFSKRCSLLAGPLVTTLCQHGCEDKQNRHCFAPMRDGMRRNFARTTKGA